MVVEELEVTILDRINAIPADAAKLAADQANQATAQAAVDAANQALADADNTIPADQLAAASDEAALSTALQTSGPAFVQNADGSISVYAYSTNPPGFTITIVQPAANVAG
jgi:multidrug efflux pump subunit AcrA (membrane-fusion protein)